MQLSSHCAQAVHDADRDRFRLSLFVPETAREGLLALYALNAELASVGGKITEELIAHIRFAWWQEAIDGLYAGSVPRGHPVLEALAPVIDAGRMPQAELTVLLEAYRAHFPNLPPDIDTIMEKIATVFFRLACPGAEASWRKAYDITSKHRRCYGQRFNGWLALRLLLG